MHMIWGILKSVPFVCDIIGYFSRRKIERRAEQEALAIERQQLENLSTFLDVDAKAKEQGYVLDVSIKGLQRACGEDNNEELIESLVRRTILDAFRIAFLYIALMKTQPAVRKHKNSAERRFAQLFSALTDEEARRIFSPARVFNVLKTYADYIDTPTQVHADAFSMAMQNFAVYSGQEKSEAGSADCAGR